MDFANRSSTALKAINGSQQAIALPRSEYKTQKTLPDQFDGLVQQVFDQHAVHAVQMLRY